MGAIQGDSDVPSFYIDTQILNGLWVWHFDTSEIEFDAPISAQIEKDYIQGKFASEGIYQEQPFCLTFGENMVSIGENQYMAERRPKEPEQYFWSVEDGTERPFVPDVQKIIQKSSGPVLFAVNDIAYRADVTSMSFENLQRDLMTALIRKVPE